MKKIRILGMVMLIALIYLLGVQAFAVSTWIGILFYTILVGIVIGVECFNNSSKETVDELEESWGDISDSYNDFGSFDDIADLDENDKEE